MPCLLNSPTSKPNCGPVWVAFVLLGIAALNTQAEIVLTVPQQVSLSANFATQQLSIFWLGGEATTFDIIILRTEINETVYYGPIPAAVNQDNGRHQWTWTSVEPLECTSLSVKIRSRDGQTISDWSEPQILKGKDLPSNSDPQMYPQDRIVPVGANTTFCCIVEEGKDFRGILYGNKPLNAKRLSRRSYSATAVNQNISGMSGTNVICPSSNRARLTGAVVFVGYPPLPSSFKCETRDLVSAVCHWDKGRDTNLYGTKRKTRYSVNNRNCEKTCVLPNWESNWTLVAVNPLGQYSLTDSAELSHRVHPVAPDNLTSVAHAWNATLLWDWKHSSYSTLALVCQVELGSHSKVSRNFTGVGLRSVVLLDLHPDEEYRLQVRCGSQKNFWKWGDWSSTLYFKTKPYVPDAPDVWMWMNRDNTGLVIWKPLTRQQSHGQITGYIVTLWNPEENEPYTKTLSPEHNFLAVNLTHRPSFSSEKVIATVKAQNVKGTSRPASVPLGLIDDEPPALGQTVYTSSGFPLTWQHHGNRTYSYVVEWCDASCSQNCLMDWIRLDAGNTNVSVQSANFQPGVRYNFSLYGFPEDLPVLVQRWQGYSQELVPSSPVRLAVDQQECDVVLTWEEIPVESRRGFILGYNVYINNLSNLKLIASLGRGATTYTVKGLSVGPYKFTVKAFTSAGEDTGETVSIRLETCADGLILEILISLGIVTLLLATVTYFCYKKRRWVKKAFYPDIPEPKLPGNWSRTQGPLDVKPPPHSMVHIVEKPEWDSSKDALVAIPEEEDYDGEAIGDEPVDMDEPHSLSYYNQVVDDRPIRPRFPDSSVSSSSSVDSANTDVTYTGIQTSCSSLVFPSDAGLSVSSGDRGGGYHPQMHLASLGGNLASPGPLVEPQVVGSGGYKPQSSWVLDSPTEAEEKMSPAPSLGSPTSVASTQFLLPDGEGHGDERQPPSAAATWFNNLLSSAKP